MVRHRIPLVLSALLLAGCVTPARGPAISDGPDTTEETQVTTHADARSAARAQSREAARHLDALVEQFEPENPEEPRSRRSASTAACTMGGPDQALSWLEQTTFAVGSDPEPMVEKAAIGLEADGWSRVKQANAGHQITLQRKGWLSVVSWIPDVRSVSVSVESPCFDDRGMPLSG